MGGTPFKKLLKNQDRAGSKERQILGYTVKSRGPSVEKKNIYDFLKFFGGSAPPPSLPPAGAGQAGPGGRGRPKKSQKVKSFENFQKLYSGRVWVETDPRGD